MSEAVEVLLDREVRRILEEEAAARSVDLAAYLQELATAEARRLRNREIRKQSKAVAAYVASNPEARKFYEDWGNFGWRGWRGAAPDFPRKINARSGRSTRSRGPDLVYAALSLTSIIE